MKQSNSKPPASNPATLLAMLQAYSHTIEQSNKGLSAQEINSLCTRDTVFRTNLLHDMRDIARISQLFEEVLEHGRD